MAGSLGRLRARLPAQQRRQRADRDAGQPAGALLARGPAPVRERRHARALGHAWSRACGGRAGAWTAPGGPCRKPRSTYGTPRPRGSTRTRIPSQAEMNLRGRFRTDADGRFHFRSVKPAGYPIPIDGPVGELIKATGRHNYRPAHLHFMIYKPGFKTLVSQIYVPDDEHIDTDVQFGVTRALIGAYVRHDEPEASLGSRGALVLARPALRSGARRSPPPQAADPRQDNFARACSAQVAPPRSGRVRLSAHLAGDSSPIPIQVGPRSA